MACRNGDPPPGIRPEKTSVSPTTIVPPTQTTTSTPTSTATAVPLYAHPLPPLHDACTTDSDCGFETHFCDVHDPGCCCFDGCADDATAGNVTWVAAMKKACAAMQKSDCPKRKCASPPKVQCVKGRCAFVP
jgi:hypothetical protein